MNGLQKVEGGFVFDPPEMDKLLDIASFSFPVETYIYTYLTAKAADPPTKRNHAI